MSVVIRHKRAESKKLSVPEHGHQHGWTDWMQPKRVVAASGGKRDEALWLTRVESEGRVSNEGFGRTLWCRQQM